MPRARRSATPTLGPRSQPSARGAVLLQWASETGAHGMPVPQDLERLGWQRLTEHPLFRGTWLMETPEALACTFVGEAARAARGLGPKPGAE